MKQDGLARRELLKSLVLVPAGYALGCQSSLQLLPPEKSLKKVALAVGPWGPAERETAENFVSRFLNSKMTEEVMAPENHTLLQRLASRFREGEMALSEVKLGDLAADEEELLLSLATQIYDLIEVRFHLRGDPPYGECQIDIGRYAREPEE